MDFDARGPEQPGPPRYVMLSDHNGNPTSNLRPPPHRRNLPRYHSHRSEGGCCACGCLFWCCFFLLLFLLLAAAAAAYLYFALDPKPPTYSVDHLSVGAFEVRPDLTLHSEVSVSVRAVNPNTMIGISYGSGSAVAVAYRGTTLCSGRLPSFYQGHRNTTVLEVTMVGRTAFGSWLQESLKENKETGRIPLDVSVRVPVGLRLGEVDLREITVNVHCSLVVDNLSPNKKVGIKSAKYDVNVDF